MKIVGSLDKNIVRRFMRRYRNRLRYCYAKQLQSNPTLRGTVLARFVIARNGSVSASSAKGVDHKVSTCVARSIRRLKFPRPKTGIVMVRIPMLFTPAGSPGRIRAVKRVPPSPVSGLSSKQIRDVISRNGPRFRACYDAELPQRPSLAGMVRVRFTIGRNGRVTVKSVSGLTANVTRCIRGVLASLRFPRSSTVSKVTYPFVFSNPKPKPKQEDPAQLSRKLAELRWGRCKLAPTVSIKPRLPAVRDCYAKALKRNPKLAGRGQIRFYSTYAGRVPAASYSGIGDRALASCIEATVRNNKRDTDKSLEAMRCELTFTNGVTPAKAAPGETLLVLPSQVIANGREVVAVAQLVQRTPEQIEQLLQQTLGPAPRAVRRARAVHLQVDHTVDTRAVGLLIRGLQTLGYKEIYFHERKGKTWNLVSDYQPPTPKVCLVENEAIELQLSVGEATMKGHDFRTVYKRPNAEDLTGAIAELIKARKKLPNRGLVTIRVGVGHPYRVLTRLIRAAAASGFTEPLVIVEHK